MNDKNRLRTIGFSHLAIALSMMLAGATAKAGLVARDLDGNAATAEAYYDTDRNISWLATSNSIGLVTWDAATAWAAALSVNGVTGWHLPTSLNPDTTCNDIRPEGSFGYGCKGSDMGHLFSAEGLGGFTGVATDNYYWSSTRLLIETTGAYVFRFDIGHQSGDWVDDPTYGSARHYAWAVHDGDVSALDVPPNGVPEPGTLALAGLALAGLAATRRRRH